MLEEQDPLRDRVEKELQESEWFQKFKAIGTLLQTLKAEVPLTQLCELKWDTSCNSLLIHCPNIEVRNGLKHQAATICQLKGNAEAIVLKYSDYPDIRIV